jgi:hypothetical protein
MQTWSSLLLGTLFLLSIDIAVHIISYADARHAYRALLPESLHDKMYPIWGLDKEGELNSVWREVGGRSKDAELNGIWCMMGNLALCRFHSKHLALRKSFSLLLIPV